MKPDKVTLQQTDKGAPAALRVIAEQEAEARKDHAAAKAGLDDAISNQLLNPEDETGNTRVQNARNHLDDVEKRWQRWLKHLREFDKAVEPDKRDAAESITKAEGKKCFAMMAIYMNNAAQTCLTKWVTTIRDARSEQDAYKEAGKDMEESILNSVKIAVAEAHLPSWSLEAVEGVL